MTGGTISGNRANEGGGVFIFKDNSFTMSGGSISGNRTGNIGGGVCVSGGSFAMSGGTISGNTASRNGGGVLIENYENFNETYIASFALSGSPAITGNTEGTGGSARASNVSLDNNKPIAIEGTLSNTTPIGVTMQTPGVFTSGWAAKMTTADPAQYFTSENAGYHAYRDASGEARLSVPSKLTTTVNPAAGGSVTVTPARDDGMYGEGETVTLLATPADGYVFDSFTVTKADSQPVTVSESNTFTMPAGGATATAKFLKSLAHSDITIEAISDQTYTGSAVKPSVTVKDGSKTLTEATNYTAAYSSNINAGTASVTLTGKGNYTGTRTAAFTIAKRPVTITAIDQTVDLNGNILTGTDKVTLTQELVDGHSLKSISLALAEGMATNAAGVFDNAIKPSEAVITAGSGSTVDLADNYSITYVSGKLTVNKIKATVTTHPKAIENLKYTGESHTLITAGAADTRMEYVLGTSADTAPTSGWNETIPTGTGAGTYFVFYRAKEDANHTPGDAFVLTAALDTTTLTVTAKNHSVTYGDAPANNGVEFSGFVHGETQSVLSGTLAYDYSYTQGDSVGSYVITPKGLTGGNYTLSFVPGVLTVQQKEVGLTWGETQLTFNGEAQAPAATATGLVNEDAITVTVTGAETNAGENYTAEASALTGDKAGNYKLPAAKTTGFSIAKGAAPTLEDVALSQAYDKTYVRASLAGIMPADAGKLTYTPGIAQATGSISVTGFAVDNSAGVTARLSGGAVDDVVTLPVVISSENYLDASVNVVITLIMKGSQTISAADVTATYGDTDKKINASVTDPVTGSGAISYAVKTGSEKYISVAANGDLTILGIPPTDGKAYVVVTAAETDTYLQATREVTVTISRANAVPATVTANNRSYDGTEKPLVTVTGTATGGEMRYALGTATEATGSYTPAIPAKTEKGSYYVWYKVVGDQYHNGTAPVRVTVTIAAPTEPIITGAALVLDGTLTLRFYAALPEVFDPTGAHMVFTIHGRTVDVPFSNAGIDEDKRTFNCPVYSIEMAEPVAAVFHYTKDGQAKTVTCAASVKEYLDKAQQLYPADTKLLALIDAVRDYGHYIQPYLARIHGFTVGEGGYPAMPAAAGSLTPVTPQELEIYKTTWHDYDRSLLDSVSYYDTFAERTSLHVIVKLKSAKTVTATLDGADCKLTSLGGRQYSVEIPNIAANNLDKSYRLVFSANGAVICDIDVSALTYVRTVLAGERSDKDEIDALTAFCNYCKAAKDYPGN